MEKLELRKQIKAKKPKFIRHDSHKMSKLKSSWRRPKGWQNKIRLNKRGYRKAVQKGYGSPKEVSGLHPTGLNIVIVSSLKDLENLTEKDGVMISSTVGAKKKIDIIKTSQEKKLTLLNLKDPAKFIKDIEDRLTKNKAAKTKKQAEKEKKKEEESKKKQEKKEIKNLENLSEDEKKKEQKKEKDKVLTKKV